MFFDFSLQDSPRHLTRILEVNIDTLSPVGAALKEVAQTERVISTNGIATVPIALLPTLLQWDETNANSPQMAPCIQVQQNKKQTSGLMFKQSSSAESHCNFQTT